MTMTSPEEIFKLVERFDRNLDAYRSGHYNETQVRQEFIDPLFITLGWDVYNRGGYAEAYKDVILEDRVRVGEATKAPDYCFRIGGTRKFFLEAKKPSANLKDDISPALQLRRYAWSAKLSLSILTDFEEFAVYDCRMKPIKTDKAFTARTKYINYKEYESRWNEIASIFSREAVLRGSFDKYVESTKLSKGTAEVDSAFLREIENWREVLARNLALRNPDLTQRELNYAVQRTIDRIIFLRICEDRGIETYGRLQALLSGSQTYGRLCDLLRVADDRYNSGLFHFRAERGREDPDQLTLGLTIDDRVLRDIIKGLYYPDSPYEFSVLPADILGQVYEQFLGRVIRLTTGHRAKVEDKPEVKKAGGVYYTPTYIVEYIVRNTVGKLLEGKTPKTASKLKILDPACGSGSFLIGAYQYLLDWHRDYYTNDRAKHRKVLYEGPGGDLRLTTTEKKKILLNNIFGVDIDPQAVEVSKLSLLLKVLEGETEDTLERQLKLFHERALPDLGNNIRCGNSLIGPDFYQKEQMSLLDEESGYRLNVFDWGAEFPRIMELGGFDAIIGNPPYVRMEGFKEIKSYLSSQYETHADRADIYYYFVEQSCNLLRKDGALGFILSNTFTRSRAGKFLRSFMTDQLAIDALVEFGDFTPFDNATVYPIIVVGRKSESKPKTIDFILQDHAPLSSTIEQRFPVQFAISQDSMGANAWIFEEPKMRELRGRLLSEFPRLVDLYGEVSMGIKSGFNEAFIITGDVRREILSSNPEAIEIIKPYVGGRDLDRWICRWKNEWIIYTYHGVVMTRYAGVLEHLRRFKSPLEKRSTQQKWYELQQPQRAFSAKFDSPKIIFPDISRYPKYNLDTRGTYFSNTVYFIASDSPYLLGLLNSKLLWFVIRGLSNALRGGRWRFRLFSGHVERLPIRAIDATRAREKDLHDQMVNLVREMLGLHERLVDVKIGQDKSVIQRRIKATDQQIDELVYELYGLSEDEIKIVEQSSR